MNTAALVKKSKSTVTTGDYPSKEDHASFYQYSSVSFLTLELKSLHQTFPISINK